MTPSRPLPSLSAGRALAEWCGVGHAAFGSLRGTSRIEFRLADGTSATLDARAPVRGGIRPLTSAERKQIWGRGAAPKTCFLASIAGLGVLLYDGVRNVPAARISARWQTASQLLRLAPAASAPAGKSERPILKLVSGGESAVRVDPETGVMNRAGLEEELDAAIFREADRALLTVQIADLDQIRRSHGDACARAVALDLSRLLKNSIPEDSLVARIDTRTFAVVLRTNHETSLAIASREVLRESERRHWASARVSLRFGGAMSRDHRHSSTMLREALGQIELVGGQRAA